MTQLLYFYLTFLWKWNPSLLHPNAPSLFSLWKYKCVFVFLDNNNGCYFQFVGFYEKSSSSIFYWYPFLSHFLLSRTICFFFLGFFRFSYIDCSTMFLIQWSCLRFLNQLTLAERSHFLINLKDLLPFHFLFSL